MCSVIHVSVGAFAREQVDATELWVGRGGEEDC